MSYTRPPPTMTKYTKTMLIPVVRASRKFNGRMKGGASICINITDADIFARVTLVPAHNALSDEDNAFLTELTRDASATEACFLDDNEEAL